MDELAELELAELRAQSLRAKIGEVSLAWSGDSGFVSYDEDVVGVVRGHVEDVQSHLWLQKVGVRHSSIIITFEKIS